MVKYVNRKTKPTKIHFRAIMLNIKQGILTITAIFIAGLLALGVGLFDASFLLIHPVGSGQLAENLGVPQAHAGGAATNRQIGYEFDLDPDGSPNGGTCRNGVNAPVTGAQKLEPFAIRVGVRRDGGGGRLRLNARIEYDITPAFSSPTQITKVLGANDFQIVNNVNHITGHHTGLQLEPGKGGATFVQGEAVDGDTGASETGEIVVRGGERTEVQFNVQATSNAVDGQQYFLRVTDGGAPLDAYDNHPDLTMQAAQGVIVAMCTEHGAYPRGTTIPIVVTAVVTDENGNAISGLSAGDFVSTVAGAPTSATFTETATAGTYTGDLDISGLSPGTPSVQVTVTDTDGVSGSGSVGFDVLDPPFNVILSTDKAQYLPGTDTTAVLTAQVVVLDYDYSLGDLTFATTLDGTSVSVTFTRDGWRIFRGGLDVSGLETGTHTVTVDVSDTLGASESGSTSLSIGEGAAAPTVTECNPEGASPGEQLTVTVSGSGFQDGASSDFGEKIVVKDGTQYVSSSQLNVGIKVHPKAAAGPRDVTITNPDGTSGTGTGCFTVG